MNSMKVLIFLIIALIILCYSNRELFMPVSEYPDEVEVEVEYEDEDEQEETPVALSTVEYPDEQEDDEISGYDAPTFKIIG